MPDPSQEIRPELSLVMPCYNEQEAIRYTIPRLVKAFGDAGHSFELIAVDNGSTDRTGEMIRELAAEHPNVVPTRQEPNEGYGQGLLHGFPLCRGRWVGTIAADGQVDPEDVVRLFEAAAATDGNVLAKVRRRFRMDGSARKVVSVAYNLFFRMLWPSIASWDINGIPKLIRREYLEAMRLRSKNWFLDPEIMIKTGAMGLTVLEVNVFARMRGSGVSHVRAMTCWEFFMNLMRYRFGGTGRGDREQARGNAERARRLIVDGHTQTS